jgi:hypothetical protein
MVLSPRVMRRMDGLDLEVYEQTIAAVREFVAQHP